MNLQTWRWADGEIFACQKTCLYSNMKQIRGIDTSINWFGLGMLTGFKGITLINKLEICGTAQLVLQKPQITAIH